MIDCYIGPASVPERISAQITNTLKLVLNYNDEIVLYFLSIGTRNWGDALNPILIKSISGKIPIVASGSSILNSNPFLKKKNPVFSVIGSILQPASNESNLIVWGSGFMSESDSLRKTPTAVCAVRGPLTREKIPDCGCDCPKVFGDPALLYPRYYNPGIEKKYQLGIVPHYSDWNNPLLDAMKADPDVLVIDVCGGVNKFVNNICSCERIASSSLHGIIAADSYGIPSIWVKLSNKVLGDGFKFFDYFLSVGRKDDEPFIITRGVSLSDIYDRFSHYKIEIDLDQLMASCPLITDPLNSDRRYLSMDEE